MSMNVLSQPHPMAKRTSIDLPIELKPMHLWMAILYFGVPALGFRLALYNGLPLLMKIGLTPFQAAVVSLTLPCAVLFAFAFGVYNRESRPITWSGVKSRLRLQRMTGKDWLWTACGFVAAFLATGALSISALAMIHAFPAITPPASFPVFLNPMVTSNITALPAALVQSIGAPIRGNWEVAILMFVMLFFNIFGEELWWRGVILPRQELAYGRWTWLIHAGLWLLFHMPIYPWRLLDLIPYCLIISFVAQRRKNTWPGIIIHWQNGMVLLAVIAMVLGLI